MQLTKNHPASMRLSVKKIVQTPEMLATIAAGLLIIAGWLLGKADIHEASTTFLVLAIIIGGYAKTVEGIEDMLKNRELNVEVLMILAAIGSGIIGYWTEGAILIFIFSLSGALEKYTADKNKQELVSLMKLQPEEALLINNGIERKVHVSDLVVGDYILIKPGERIPCDGTIVRGQTAVDEATITGESFLVSKTTGDNVFAGTVNLRGAVTVRVTKPSTETVFQKIIDLVQTAQSSKSPSQLFIEKFEKRYVLVVLLIVGLVILLSPSLFDWSWKQSFYRAMVFLVVASPCALVASITPATLAAIAAGAKQGILFKGGVHIEQLAGLKAIAFDKTRTLTKGNPVVTDVYIRPDCLVEDVVWLSASIENCSNHPLAEAIVKYGKEVTSKEWLQLEKIEDIPGWGIVAHIGEETWKMGKAEFVGKTEAESFHDRVALELSQQGKTIVYIANSKGIVGLFALKDEVRSESVKAINNLKKFNIYTVMLTGDSDHTAKSIASEVNVDRYVAKCLPETKVEELLKLKAEYQTVAMVGDGINDAPALANADVGIAMGEGTDIALEAADVVLKKNNLQKITQAIYLAKKMNKIIKQNIVLSVGVILLLIMSNLLQWINLPIGVIGHEGSTILVILNGLRLLKTK